MCLYVFRRARICVCMYLGVPGYVFVCIKEWLDMCFYVFMCGRICVCMYLGVPGYVFVCI